jgi:hypothetical protein
VYVTGYRKLRTGQSYVTIKYSPAGVTRWVAGYDGPGMGHNVAKQVRVTSAGHVYVTGVSWGGAATDNDILTLKYRANGTRLWARRYDGAAHAKENVSDMALDADNNVYLAASLDGGAATQHDFALVKYTSGSTLSWARLWDGTAHQEDAATAVAVDGSVVIVTGYVRSVGTGDDYFTAWYSTGGVFQWSKMHNGAASGDDRAVDVVAAGDVFVTGSAKSGLLSQDYDTVKYNSASVEQWVRSFHTDDENRRPAAMGLDAAGNVYVTGSRDNNLDPVSIGTIKYDSAGVQQWASDYAPTGAAQGADIALATGGVLYVTGMKWTGDPSTRLTDYVTIKYVR